MGIQTSASLGNTNLHTLALGQLNGLTSTEMYTQLYAQCKEDAIWKRALLCRFARKPHGQN